MVHTRPKAESPLRQTPPAAVVDVFIPRLQRATTNDSSNPTDCCRLYLRADQSLQLLRPVLIDVLQDVVLLNSAIAVSHRQQAFAEIEISPSEIRLESDCLSECLSGFVQLVQL